MAPLVLIMLAEMEARDTREIGAAINGRLSPSHLPPPGGVTPHPGTKTGNTGMIFYHQCDLGIVIMGRAGDDNIISDNGILHCDN